MTSELQQTSAAQTNLGSAEASRAPTPATDVLVRPAVQGDAETIAAIGARVFNETFAHTCTEADMHSYLSSNFTPGVIAAEIEDDNKTVLVACVRGLVAAFCVLTRGTSEDCIAHVPAEKRIEVQRVYADSRFQGAGVARVLMEHTLATAKKMGFGYAWLGVWENNVRATRFYQKFGFEKVGQHDFWLGDDRQIDYIFATEL